MQHKSTIWEVFVPACSWRASTTVLLLEMGGASVLRCFQANRLSQCFIQGTNEASPRTGQSSPR